MLLVSVPALLLVGRSRLLALVFGPWCRVALPLPPWFGGLPLAVVPCDAVNGAGSSVWCSPLAASLSPIVFSLSPLSLLQGAVVSLLFEPLAPCAGSDLCSAGVR